MEQETDLLAKILKVLNKVVLYAEQTKDIFILTGIEKASKLMADITGKIIIALLTCIIVLFGSIALAWYLGECLDNLPMGFLFVTLFYFITLVAFIFLNKSVIQVRFINYFIKKMIHG